MNIDDISNLIKLAEEERYNKMKWYQKFYYNYGLYIILFFVVLLFISIGYFLGKI